MANKVYTSENMRLIDGTEIYVTPLKIKYLREFMEYFSDIKKSKDDEDAMDRLVKCVAICMKQYDPKRSTVSHVEDLFDINMIYRVLDISADIKVEDRVENTIKQNITESKGDSWDTLDLVKLESELFLIGIWKDYEELEKSLSIPELLATLKAKRDVEYVEKKFLAAIQGINLDEQVGETVQDEDPWERIKARAAARIAGKDPDEVQVNPDDITSLTGFAAKKAGFGIGDGLEYQTW